MEVIKTRGLDKRVKKGYTVFKYEKAEREKEKMDRENGSKR